MIKRTVRSALNLARVHKLLGPARRRPRLVAKASQRAEQTDIVNRPSLDPQLDLIALDALHLLGELDVVEAEDLGSARLDPDGRPGGERMA